LGTSPPRKALTNTSVATTAEESEDDPSVENPFESEGSGIQARPLVEIVGEEIEVDSEAVPEARKTFEKIKKELDKTWPNISHQTGGSTLKLERMYKNEHIIITCECDSSVSIFYLSSSGRVVVGFYQININLMFSLFFINDIHSFRCKTHLPFLMKISTLMLITHMSLSMFVTF
jgi:hypothetical protein